MHVLLRPVLYVLRHRRAQRQPGPVRPALPPELRLERPGGRPPPVPEGYVAGGAPPRTQRNGRGLRQDRGAHEAAGIRLGGHENLRRRPAGGPGTHRPGAAGAGGGLFPAGLYRRLLYGTQGAGDVRRPGKHAGATGAVCRGPGGL